MKRSPINRVSKRRQKESRIYQKERLLFLEENPNCLIKSGVCTYEATCIHHGKGRHGSFFLDKEFWFPSCISCNSYLETGEGKAWGYKHGFRLDRIGINK